MNNGFDMNMSFTITNGQEGSFDPPWLISPSVNAEGGFDLSVERVSGLEPLVLMRVDIDDARLTILIRGFGDIPDGITMLHQVGHLSVVVPNHGLFKKR
jgi:hypothetical protein